MNSRATSRRGLLGAMWLLATCGSPVLAVEPWVDVHFHIVGDAGQTAQFANAARDAVAVMDESHIRKALIMPPPRPSPNFDFQELRVVRDRYPDRIAFMGGGGTLNPMMHKFGHGGPVPDEAKARFEALAEQIVASGAKGFGEIAIHHVSLNSGHAYEAVPADNELMLLLADIAARHDLPIDVHFDPVPETTRKPRGLRSPKNPPKLEENVAAFERLLAHNRNARIVWAHAGSDPVGFFTPALVTRLLKAHPNLYCSIRTTYPANGAMRHPMRGVNGAWIDVLKAFPDRFVLGTDSFVVAPGYTGPDGPKVFASTTRVQREGANVVLRHLGADLARKIGRDNAARLYRIAF